MRMETGIGHRLSVADLAKYVLAYVFWVIAAAASMLSILLIRSALNVVWPLMGGNRWLLRPIDRFGLVLMGVAWLMFVIFSEQHYRHAVTRGIERKERTVAESRAAQEPRAVQALKSQGVYLLLRRFAATLSIPVGLMAVSYLVQQLTVLLSTG